MDNSTAPEWEEAVNGMDDLPEHNLLDRDNPCKCSVSQELDRIDDLVRQGDDMLQEFIDSFADDLKVIDGKIQVSIGGVLSDVDHDVLHMTIHLVWDCTNKIRMMLGLHQSDY